MPTAVFLFTDIEGSTRRWSADPDGMRDALARHDGALTAAVKAAGGTVFKHTGDGVLARFPTAAGALQGAAAGQHALRTIDWGRGASPLRVRMAVHAGDAEPRGDDWFGPALNRCARLLGLGHGGQVLVSDAVRALCVDSLPPGLDLVDLGAQPLRDLQNPERVWQLTGDDLEAGFPDLRSSASVPGNVPTPLTPFVGRAAELAELVNAVAAHRLVTVLGPGGMGKTRLAVEVAESMAHHFPGGVWLVELASVEQDAGTAHALVDAIGAQAGAGVGPVQLAGRFLAGRRALLVLDNCEHVTDSAAAIAEELLRTARDLSILTTSRRPLGADGEQLRPLGPLASDDQVALFEQRAAASGQARALDADLVRDVCGELDGMPLAIELAAARLRSMTLPELARRLPQRFRLLSGGRSTERRHQSLEALVAWSFEQLADPERALFARLSVLVGDFDLDAAHAVAGRPDGDDLDTLTGLDSLVERSLLVADERHGEARYRMLETLRQYGEARLGPTAGELRNRHAVHFTSLIGRLRTSEVSGRGSYGERVEEEFANIRTAFQHTLAQGDDERCLTIVSELTPYTQLRPTLEVAEWADAALDAAAGQVSESVVRAHLSASGVRHFLADWQAAERHAVIAMELDRRLDGSHAASALIVMAPPITYLGRLEEAYRTALAGVAAAERTGRPVLQAAGRAVLMHCALYAGHTPDAEEFERMLDRAERAEGAVVRAYTRTSLGLAALVRGHADAARWLAEGAEHAAAINHLHLMCLHRTYHAMARARAEPASELFALRVALVEYGAVRIPLGPRQIAAELIHHFADLARWETVATLHGATPPVSLHPELAALARQAAGAALGQATFERLAEHGRAMLHHEFAAFLHGELDALGVAPHRAGERIG